jgi:hypothetical protein
MVIFCRLNSLNKIANLGEYMCNTTSNLGTRLAHLPNNQRAKHFVTLTTSLVLLNNISSFSSIPSFSTTSLKNARFSFRDQYLNKLIGWGIGVIWAIYISLAK